MSDLFHEDIPYSYVKMVMATIHRCPQHTFQILTKRAERMADFFKRQPPPPNAWIGVSVENRSHGLPRIEYLRTIDVRVRFISAEPLLEDLGIIDLSDIHWVIVGGESGPSARPMKREWALKIKSQCECQKSAFFFKQWGVWGADGIKRAKKHNGRLLNGRTYDAMPLHA